MNFKEGNLENDSFIIISNNNFSEISNQNISMNEEQIFLEQKTRASSYYVSNYDNLEDTNSLGLTVIRKNKNSKI